MKGEISGRIESLVKAIENEHERLNIITKLEITLKTEVINDVLWATFSKGDLSKSIRIPLPIKNNKGIELLHNNDVTRAVCDYWLEREQCRLNYHEIIERLMCSDVNDIMPAIESRSSFISKIMRAFEKDMVAFMIDSLQRLINEIVNIMPLHETDMNSWAMNHRLTIIDPDFDEISDPNRRLEYQVEKNKKYYSMFGWTSIGLSEGTLADKNAILTTDLRKITPFGLYHNPQRNLYSTLGMKGDELPRVRSKSMNDMIENNMSRKGWNFVTTVLDTPLNFEDQILVDNRHRGLFTVVERKFTVYGEKLKVKTGDNIEHNSTLGISSDDTPVKMNMKCDEAKVTKISNELTDVGGEQVIISIIIVIGKRYLRDGSKFSNLHGNKGVVKFADLGYAINPKSAKEVPIDVMISGSSINRRANFGQILEMLANNTMPGEDPIVVEDNYQTEIQNVENRLEKDGYPRDGTWIINTYCGEFSAVTGKMFWGVTKDPQDQLWEEKHTYLTNNRELRTSGLKFSHVEIKALTTRFGTGNPVVKEILSSAQGIEIINDELKILMSMRGEIDESLPVINASSIKFVDGSKGIFHDENEIKDTVLDEEFMPEGFVLQLPTDFQVIVDKKDLENFVCGMPQHVQDVENKTVYLFNKIFIPNALLRRCWKHGSGKWGLSVIGALINRIIEHCYKFTLGDNVSAHSDLMRSITLYFINIAKIMGTKRGELSTYGMAVRYPYSTHAIAALSDKLPKNTIEIHEEMANDLKVKTGDIVIAERFPCLGFMSIRPQYVEVTKDPQCKYVIRISGNSLVSMNLDFDGDTLFLASFHTPQAKEALAKEMKTPNRECEDIIEEMNRKKIPQTKEVALNDLEIKSFNKPTNEEHAELVRKATGVKSHTGPVIALAYNLMRIVEKNVPYENIKEHVNIEVLLDFLGNTVFKQKHGIKSLQEEATDAICTADVDKMVSLGFDRDPSLLLCNLIIREAAKIGVVDLVRHNKNAKENGGSKIINKIVRTHNKIYFASRAKLGPFNLLDHLESDPVDMPSYMMTNIMSMAKKPIEEKLGEVKLKRAERKLKFYAPSMVDAYDKIAGLIDRMIGGRTNEAIT